WRTRRTTTLRRLCTPCWRGAEGCGPPASRAAGLAQDDELANLLCGDRMRSSRRPGSASPGGPPG
ncbi:MAG: hypothetical protein AVDCRST_MAG22-3634, partial [uncultured Rubrobacteraceae bacterium]